MPVLFAYDKNMFFMTFSYAFKQSQFQHVTFHKALNDSVSLQSIMV